MPVDNAPKDTTVCAPVLPESGSSPRYDAYEQSLPDMATLDAKCLANINIDLASAAALVLAHLPGLIALRPTVQAELPKYDLAKFDSLGRVALALQHANARFVAATTPPSDLFALNAEGMKLRDQLRADAQALAAHELIDARPLDGLRLLVGYRNIAVDLMALTTLFRNHAATVAAKTLVDSAMLERADEVADRLLAAAIAHDQGSTAVADVTQTRQRAFTLFANTYDHIRRAVTYLRWADGDADLIAPSIYAGRGHAKKEAKSDLHDASDPVATPANDAPATPTVNVPVGMPGGSPFLS